MPEVIDYGPAQNETAAMVSFSLCWQFTSLRMGIPGFYYPLSKGEEHSLPLVMTSWHDVVSAIFMGCISLPAL